MFDRELLHLPKIRSTLCCLVLFSLLEAACIFGQAFGLSRALVSLWQGATFVSVIGELALFACSFVGVRVVLDLREAFITRYAHRTALVIRQSLFEALFRTGAPAVQKFGTGATAAMLLEGIDKVKDYLELVLPKLVNMAILPIVFAVAIAQADWVSGIIVVILLPSMILLMILVGKTTAGKGRSQHATFKVMSNHFIDSVRGIQTLETFAISKTYAQRVFEVSERFRKATMQTLKMATISGALLDLFATLALAAVSIMLGLRLIDGSLTLLPALFVLILVPEFFRPIREFASNHHATLDGINSLRTIGDMLSSIGDEPDSIALPAWGASEQLRVEGLMKTYEGCQVIADLSFELNGFERIGVIGTSGAGKSTLLRILAGLEDPTVAAISIDGTVSLGSLRQRDWQDQIAYIPQNPSIFHASLRENLIFYNPQANDAMIFEALRVLGLKDLVDELPEGLETIIGEGGRPLSGGQAQRIALARAFLDDKRKILFFDEPTAHLDIETEYELKQPMLKLMEGKLVVFATHRLHWLDAFDRVIVLEEGRLVEEGTLEQLRRSGEQFNRLVGCLRGGESA